MLPSHIMAWCRDAPIHLAVAMNDIKMVEELIAHSANLDVEAEKLNG